jgi:hypothetical protein
LNLIFHFVAQQNGFNIRIQRNGKLAGLPNELQGYVLNPSFSLLGKYQYRTAHDFCRHFFLPFAKQLHPPVIGPY